MPASAMATLTVPPPIEMTALSIPSGAPSSEVVMLAVAPCGSRSRSQA